jgi:ATP-dependent helicase/nuclease subunit B
MNVTITPSSRLAYSIRFARALRRQEAGETAWLSAPVLTWSQWLSQLLDEQILAGAVSQRPITPQQALALWSDIVSDDISVGATGVASLCMQAWEKLHGFNLPSPDEWSAAETSVDATQFEGWLSRYESALEEHGFIDPARWARDLPDLIRAGQFSLPDHIEFSGFALGLTPLQRSVEEALVECGVDVRSSVDTGDAGDVSILAADDFDEEIELAAAWARQRLDRGDRRIGIVVTDLSSRIEEVDRVMKRVLLPGHLSELRDEMRPWHIALGAPLSSFPVVSLALDALRLSSESPGVAVLGSLLRSPFFVSDIESQCRAAAIDAKLRDLPGASVTFSVLERVAGHVDADGLLARFSSWREVRLAGEDDREPGQWAHQFMAELSAMSYGAGAALTSPEYQSWRAFIEVVDELSAVGGVLGRISRARALDLLVQFCNGRLFREKNLGAPIEIMSPKEAMGGAFDALWVQGVDDTNWPSPAQPDAFLPRYLQDVFLEATPEGQHQQAEIILGSLRCAAPEVVMSYARFDGDLELRLSDLVGGSHLSDLSLLRSIVPAFPRQAELDDCGEDIQAPVFEGDRVKGGTQVLYDQAVCPFRAFARHRLRAIAVQEPQSGLDARLRGTLMHDALERFWGAVRGSEALKAMSGDDLAVLAHDCAQQAMRVLEKKNPDALSEEVTALELERLKQRLLDWTEMERQRPDFTVEAIEQKHQVEIGGLHFSIKLDRVDRVESGLIPIDYKTGSPKPARWSTLGRIEDPQLPCYALAMDKPPAGIAFGKLKPSELGFVGISAFNEGIPGVQEMEKCSRGLFRHHSDWGDLLAEWEKAIGELVAEYRDGVARVAPIRAGVCDWCELKSLCRLRHRMEKAA